MFVVTEWKGDVPVFTMSGRLDAFGAQEALESLGKGIRDDTVSIVLDLTGVDYLSSGGIRMLLLLKKRMKEREGIVAISGIQEYPRKVLHMAGFLTVFSLHPTVRDALVACARTGKSGGLLADPGHPETVINGVRYTREPGLPGKATLHITGSLEKVLQASLTEADIRAIGFSEAEYSIGLGALGKDIGEAAPFLGEMITLHGSMVYVPTDGHFTPDFFNPVRDTGDIRIFTGYNIALRGPFHEIIRVETDRPGGISLGELYRSFFSLAGTSETEGPGIMSIAMWAVVEGVLSSEIIRAPLKKYAPENGRSIMDPTNYREWNTANSEPRYTGDTLVSFGIGIATGKDLSGFDEADIRAIMYNHPDNPVSSDMFLHNHGAIFRNVPWNPALELSRQMKAIVQDGEFVDMRHLMDGTCIRRAKCGVSYISGITRSS